MIALVALYSAFIAEIYRSALEAIPRGQREAGLAVGMSPSTCSSGSSLPQATKIAVPNIGSMFIGMVKDTSVFTIIGLLEVVRVTQNINSITFQPFVLYTGAAFLYVIAAFGIDFVFRAIEKSLSTPPKGRIAISFTADGGGACNRWSGTSRLQHDGRDQMPGSTSQRGLPQVGARWCSGSHHTASWPQRKEGRK